MQPVIDTTADVGGLAVALASAGVRTVIRYYNNRNTPVHPNKCLTARELGELLAAGLSVAIVFEQRGGANGHIEDLTQAMGRRDGARAMALAASLGQPAGSAIYFAVDADFVRTAELVQIEDYFKAVRDALGGRYRCGCYGSGLVGRRLTQAGLVDLVWLSGSTGWSGTKQALTDGSWALFQKDLDQASPVGGFDHDGNVVNPAQADFGQFDATGVQVTPRGMGAAALLRVAARSGLNLRTGPGESFRVMQTLPQGALVRGLSQDGGWVAVDLEGDGVRDGYMFAGLLEAASGGLPLDPGPHPHPLDVARQEMAVGVREYPGDKQNPRIVMYHATTEGGVAPDETAWCSSFVNYCVEQAGLVGTNSKWARSWHDAGWGRDVTATPMEGDIVVWRRHGAGDEGGHVAFFLDQADGAIRVLGGNQSNSVCIRTFPVHGLVAPYQYDLLSIRRA